MNSPLLIKIRKRSFQEWLTFFVFIMPFLMATLSELLPFPTEIRYLIDVAWIFLLIIMAVSRPLDKTKIRVLWAVVVLFLLYTVVNYIFQYQSILYYVWGLRNNFRYYVAFFAFTAYFTAEQGEDILDFFDKMLWLNLIVTSYQYFVLGYKGDPVGGIFGSVKSCNGYLNILLVIVIIKSLIYTFNNKETVASTLLKCGAAIVIMAYAEVKFFYIEFLLIIILTVLMTRFSWKKFGVVIGAVGVVFLGMTLLMVIHPEFGENVFTVDKMMEIVTDEDGYSNAGDVNRFTAIGTITEQFFPKFTDSLVGMGMGNCEYSGISIFNTPFYEAHPSLHYNWFSAAFIFIENGYLGLIFFWGFFIALFVAVHRLQKTNQANPYHCMIAKILSICCILISIYNGSLRMESGYIAYFVLALPFMERTTVPVIQEVGHEN